MTDRVLLMGNEAIARGALEAGVSFCSGYPGNPSSEIIDTLLSHKSCGRTPTGPRMLSGRSMRSWRWKLPLPPPLRGCAPSYP
jgi:pyruvate/2-oxoacid:ferredoxin oxidoreductase alpha subunit